MDCPLEHSLSSGYYGICIATSSTTLFSCQHMQCCWVINVADYCSLVFLGNYPIFWRSKKHDILSCSNAEDKYNTITKLLLRLFGFNAYMVA